MHLPVFVQEDTGAQGYAGVQEGLDLLKAYMGISDPRVREKILTWVTDVHAASTGTPDKGSSKHPLADESGASPIS